jgi:hypothetical protein
MKIERLFDYITKQYDDGPIDKFVGSRDEAGNWNFL